MSENDLNMIDLVYITHLNQPWGPSWTLATLGDPWRPFWGEMDIFKHVAKGLQESPLALVAEVLEGPQGWLR